MKKIEEKKYTQYIHSNQYAFVDFIQIFFLIFLSASDVKSEYNLSIDW